MTKRQRLQHRVGTQRLEILRLTPDRDRAWALFPTCLRRINDFIRETGAEGDPVTICNNVKALFMNGADTLGLWVIIAPSVGIISHTLAFAQHNEQLGLRWTFVLQTKIDVALPSAITHAVMDELVEWSRAQNSKYIEILTPLPERLWERYGFTLHRRVMRRSL